MKEASAKEWRLREDDALGAEGFEPVEVKMSNEMARPAARPGWERFEEAVYHYARECALMELEQEGRVGPPGEVWWALGYLPAFFKGLDKSVFEGVCVDTDYHRQEAEYRFLVTFRHGWQLARVPLSEETAS